MADPFHDRADDREVARPIDARDPEADRRRDDRPVPDRVLHHPVQHLLDFELARRLQVRAAAARLGDDVALLVGQQADRLGSTRIQTEHMNHENFLGRAKTIWAAL